MAERSKEQIIEATIPVLKKMGVVRPNLSPKVNATAATSYMFAEDMWDDVNVMLYATNGDADATRIVLTWNADHMHLVTLMFDYARAWRRTDGEDEWAEVRSETDQAAWKARIEAKYGQAAQ